MGLRTIKPDRQKALFSSYCCLYEQGSGTGVHLSRILSEASCGPEQHGRRAADASILGLGQLKGQHGAGLSHPLKVVVDSGCTGSGSGKASAPAAVSLMVSE